MLDRRERAAEASGQRDDLLSTKTTGRPESTSSMGATETEDSGSSSASSGSATSGPPAPGEAAPRDDPTWGRHRK